MRNVHSYILEKSLNLIDWKPLGRPIPGTGQPHYVQDPSWTENQAAYYRLRESSEGK